MPAAVALHAFGSSLQSAAPSGLHRPIAAAVQSGALRPGREEGPLGASLAAAVTRGVALAAAGGSAAALHGRAAEVRRSGGMRRVVRCRAADTTDGGEPGLAREIESVRGEVEVLEAARRRERRLERARELLGGEEALGKEALRGRLADFLGVQLSQEAVDALLRCEPAAPEASRALGLEALAGEPFDAALREAVQRQREAEREERLRLSAAESSRVEEPEWRIWLTRQFSTDAEGLPSPFVRFLACLPYIFPLADGGDLAQPLINAFPACGSFFWVLSPLTALLDVSDLAKEAAFALLLILAFKQDLPRIIRFNLSQAVYLDVTCYAPAILLEVFAPTPWAEYDAGISGPEVLFWSYMLVLVTVAYCFWSNARGFEPDRVPIVST
eukprot:CAMPEP_0177347506 /NCGR_PEP_ID=MMETSP0368-20130122/29761_1 /TAXON_ID=447022 ORGANISM="Scrippsiella hangoei-like, Strain SHHI-4" /NCGR_SAMPLE_ID=MMETSP0368 /ASSEMBLY_ACC=CAM_ASM_000363 /LENGTH=385 /DNA_ID=CAMNT_0018809241 /DNA_START=69 /DNA_END=1223 /DNA_ORIENTATION=+